MTGITVTAKQNVVAVTRHFVKIVPGNVTLTMLDVVRSSSRNVGRRRLVIGTMSVDVKNAVQSSNVRSNIVTSMLTFMDTSMSGTDGGDTKDFDSDLDRKKLSRRNQPKQQERKALNSKNIISNEIETFETWIRGCAAFVSVDSN